MTEIGFQRQAYDRLAWEPGMVPFRFNCGRLTNGYSQAVTWGADKENAGVADLGVLLTGGRFAWIELKQPGKKPRPSQRKFARMVKDQAGLYYIARTLGDIEKIIKELRGLYDANYPI